MVGVRGNAEHLADGGLRRRSYFDFFARCRSRRPLAGANLRPGDVVLVKGSRGVRLERAIEMAKELLAAEVQ